MFMRDKVGARYGGSSRWHMSVMGLYSSGSAEGIERRRRQQGGHGSGTVTSGRERIERQVLLLVVRNKTLCRLTSCRCLRTEAWQPASALLGRWSPSPVLYTSNRKLAVSLQYLGQE